MEIWRLVIFPKASSKLGAMIHQLNSTTKFPEFSTSFWQATEPLFIFICSYSSAKLRTKRLSSYRVREAFKACGIKYRSHEYFFTSLSGHAQDVLSKKNKSSIGTTKSNWPTFNWIHATSRNRKCKKSMKTLLQCRNANLTGVVTVLIFIHLFK